MHHHVQDSEYDRSQGIDLFAYLQKAACEALKEYTYIKTSTGDRPNQFNVSQNKAAYHLFIMNAFAYMDVINGDGTQLIAK
jgi:hypothetical protein